MDRKRLSLLILSSAMFAIWACGEGSVSEATDADEMVLNLLTEKSGPELLSLDSGFLSSEYCKKHADDCKLIESSSSSKKESSSSSAKSSSSGKSSSSSSKGSSSSAKSSSSVSSSSSVKGSSSSSKGASSSSAAPTISGHCEVVKNDVVLIGDKVIWKYVPDEGSIQSAAYEWDVSSEVEKGIVEGELSGTGTPKLTVVFTKAGKKYGPMLTFGGETFDCEEEVRVVEKSDVSSSSSAVEESSSSSEASSSSKAKSSSSSAVKGHCAVSKSVVYVGEEVDWYIAGPDGEMLSGTYNWIDLGEGAEIVSGENSGKGETKVTVVYSTMGNKVPFVQYGTQSLTCDQDDDGNQLLEVKAQEKSSSSEAPEESSSSEEVVVKSSSSKGENPNPCPDGNCEVIDF